MGEIAALLLTWPLAILVLRLFGSAMVTAGLPMAYLVGLALIHCPGAAIYLVDGYSYRDPEIIREGFRLTTLGLWCFCAGVVVVRFWASRRRRLAPARDRWGTAAPLLTLEQAALWFLAIGLFTQLVVMPLVGNIATITSVLSGLSSLSVVGVCLGIWHAILVRRNRLLIVWLLVAFTFPFITLTHKAFLGFGVHKLIVVLAFISSFRRLDVRYVFILLILSYLGVSLFVAYMKDRNELREIVWQQRADYSQRVDLIEKMVFNLELFDPANEKHLLQIDRRLNQNHFVALAIRNIERGSAEIANGQTIWFSIVALVPRAIWPGKPTVGGGGDIVSKYTGLEFARHTSVGAGQVFEFYINFGFLGVVFGFLIFGATLAYIDQKAMRSLASGSFQSYIIWFLPGIGFLQAGGNLVEITTSAGAAIGSAIVAIMIGQRFLRSRSIRRQQMVR